MAEQQHVLTADEIFAAKDTETREFVACPEWGHVEVEEPDPTAVAGQEGMTRKVKKPKGVFVRGLTLKERGTIRKVATTSVADPEAPGGRREALDAEKLEALMVVHSSVDASGRPIFKPTDWEGLMQRLGGPINRIAKRSMELSGMLLTEKKLGE